MMMATRSLHNTIVEAVRAHGASWSRQRTQRRYRSGARQCPRRGAGKQFVPPWPPRGMEVTMFSERTLAETIDHLNRRGLSSHQLELWPEL